MVVREPHTTGSNPVRECRKVKRVTQAELAEAVGVSRQTIIAVERGDYSPSVYLAIRIARTLERSVEELFALEEEPR